MPGAVIARAAGSVEVRALRFARGAQVPNNDRYPAVLAKDALGGANDDRAVRRLLEANGWDATWTWQVYDSHHFHPDAFEALAVASGSATLMLGGPQGEEVEFTAGDAAILPPGFGHRQIAASPNFRVCGAYPPGQEDYTIIRADGPVSDEVLEAIARVPTPRSDPVWGAAGPLLAALLSGKG